MKLTRMRRFCDGRRRLRRRFLPEVRILLAVAAIVWISASLTQAPASDFSWPVLRPGKTGPLQRPEPFLEYLTVQMEEFRLTRGTYARSIVALIPRVHRKRSHLSGIRADTYSYRIETATTNHYRITATEKDGPLVYEVTSEYPRPSIVWRDEGQRGRIKGQLLARIGASARGSDEEATLLLHLQYLCPDREVKQYLLNLVMDKGVSVRERDIACEVLREIICRADSEALALPLSSFLGEVVDNLKDVLVLDAVLDMLAILHDRRSLAPLRSALERCPEDIPGGYLPIKTRMRELIQSLERDYGEELKGERGRRENGRGPRNSARGERGRTSK